MNLNKYIDHTLLKQGATYKEIENLCEEAIIANFASVCIPPYFVKYAKKCLSKVDNHDIKVCTVIGFPFGYFTTESKIQEIITALEDGADELDIVQNVSAVKNGDWEFINTEIYKCLHAVYKSYSFPIIKIILETGILTDEEIRRCCQIYGKYSERTTKDEWYKISFIKTSTGYAAEPYTGKDFIEQKLKAVKIMIAHSPAEMEIKASGGIRDYAFTKKLIEAGANRIGCSAGIKIINEFLENYESQNIESQSGGY